MLLGLDKQNSSKLHDLDNQGSNQTPTKSADPRARAYPLPIPLPIPSPPKGPFTHTTAYATTEPEISGLRPPEVGDARNSALAPPDNGGGKAGAQCLTACRDGRDSPEILNTDESRRMKRDGGGASSLASDLNGQSSQRFGEWWEIWAKVRGTNHHYNAEQVYPRNVTVAMEEDCLACTRSYLDHLSDPRKGYNPENFIIDQAKDGFKARWKIQPERKTRQQEQADAWRDA